MLISTTSKIEGKNIKEYKGVVFGEVINRMNLFKDFSENIASIANFSGCRVSGYEEELINTRTDAINEMIKRAKELTKENKEDNFKNVFESGREKRL